MLITQKLYDRNWFPVIESCVRVPPKCTPSSEHIYDRVSLLDYVFSLSWLVNYGYIQLQYGKYFLIWYISLLGKSAGLIIEDSRYHISQSPSYPSIQISIQWRCTQAEFKSFELDFISITKNITKSISIHRVYIFWLSAFCLAYSWLRNIGTPEMLRFTKTHSDVTNSLWHYFS